MVLSLAPRTLARASLLAIPDRLEVSHRRLSMAADPTELLVPTMVQIALLPEQLVPVVVKVGRATFVVRASVSVVSVK